MRMEPLRHDHCMTESRPDQVAAAVQEVAVAVQRDRPSIGAEVARYIIERVPDLSHTGVEDVVLEASRANMTILLDYIARGVPLETFAPSAEVIHLTRTLVQRGVSLAAITRAYSVGTQYVIEVWADAVSTYGPDDRRSLEVVKLGTLYTLAWMDLITERLSDEYRRELERLARERGLARVEDVRRVLTETDIDVDAAGTRLGYRLTGRHVALVLRDISAAPDGSAFDAALRELTAAVGTGRGLSVRVDMRTTWCWLPSTPVSPRRVPPPTVPVLVAVGRSATGLEGFRRSHREALDALRVAEIAQCPPGTVTYYDDVDIAAMCSIDPDRYRDFVQTELGDLAANDRSTRRLRDTLGAFYAANSNYRATGANLGIHHNTVRYRIDQAIRLLGHGVEERRLAVELALHLAEVLEHTSGEEVQETLG